MVDENRDLDLTETDLSAMTDWPDSLIDDYANKTILIRELLDRLTELEAKVNLHHP
jgi:hypothetical protein